MQVEESIMCQAELAEVCLGHRNGIISGVLRERKPKKIQEWDIRLHTPRARSVSQLEKRLFSSQSIQKA